MDHKPLDLAQVRARLAGARGAEYWRSLEELAQTEGFQELLRHEYPRHAGEWLDPVSRRHFLMLAAASLGLAGLSGCTAAPHERIVPYVQAPDGLTPGCPLFFATAMAQPGGGALGLLVESHEGRPTKVEGNPDHPSTPRAPGAPERVRWGATDLFAQASVLTLYDPDRSQTVTHLGSIATWDSFIAAFMTELRQPSAGDGGRGLRLRVLTESLSSPSLAFQVGRLLQRFPAAKWHVHEPVGNANARDGARLAFNERVVPQYRLSQADVILALDADFLCEGPDHVRHLHDFAGRRRVRQGRTEGMNRLYVVESTPSGTGAIADHRLPLRSADVVTLARSIAAKLDAGLRPNQPQFLPPTGEATLRVPPGWIDAVADDLKKHQGKCLVIPGERQPPFVHALAHALNDLLGNVGKTVIYTEPAELEPAVPGSLRELVDDMLADRVDVLVMLGANPAYTAPADVPIADAMGHVRLRIHQGLYQDETSELCHWHIPEAHFLESWGDVRASDGTVSIVQPLIAPLFGGKTAAELVTLLTDQQQRSSHEIVRTYWRSLFDAASPQHQAVRADWQRQGLMGAFTGDFETWWHECLRKGIAAGTQLPAKTVTLQNNWIATPPAAPVHRDLELVFRPDPTVYDGRFANNGWLQELPKPLSKLTWDNAAYLSPATAERLGLANEKVVRLAYQGRTVEAPVWVLPGHADESITIHLGYGRTRAGRIGNNLGFNAYRLRTANALWHGTGLEVQPTNRRLGLACTQHHHLMENRDIVRSGTRDNPPHREQHRRLSLYDESEHRHAGNQWAMVIDLNVCTGCSACVVACQAENNIPIVGKDQVQRGREMHWLRVDQYYQGPSANPQTFYQPVPCMHCENAPCELVCPVGATVHSTDGLNDMVYNRCVGTRYCSNNCPYKVRRFNFLQYDLLKESVPLVSNPEVTVRSRGVMEKCTYCVQRIRSAHIAATCDDRSLQDGDVVTACQAACPAGAIVFGDLNDRDGQGRPKSQVGQLRSEPLHYALLEELNTRPRTTYLAALKNPKPEMGNA